MKPFVSYFLSVIFLISVLNAHPTSKNYTKKNFQQSMKLTDKTPDTMSIPEEKSLSCVGSKTMSRMQICETEYKKEPSAEEMKKLTTDAEKKGFYWLNLVNYCECFITKSDLVDMETGQLQYTKLSQMLEETTLSAQQKSSVSTDMKSCMDADLINPNLPLYIKSIGKKPDHDSGNTVSVVQTTMCIAISLLQNGCSDASLDSSTVALVIQGYTTLRDLAKSSSSEEE